ncbi:MAG TPA: hypothetical protein VNY05_33620 [Candidatus Acidoferrales bacterium]|jgi:hypothetical protein|nr:hypothetical protein [Candidatus Acidoferrales bacterium]
MILDRRQSSWAVGTSAGAAVSLAIYIVYVLLSPNGARGGSAAGLFFAALGTGAIVFECLLSLRKKYPASPLGRVKTWLSAHVWLGLLSFLLILEHAGFRWGRGLAGALMWTFAVILVSGIFGVAMQNYIPKRMTELVPKETIYEQIPTVVRGLRMEADERAEFVTADLGFQEEDVEFIRAGGIKQYFDPAQKKGAAEKLQVFIDKRKASPQIEIDESARLAVRAHYLQEIRPFLTDSPAPASNRLLGSRELVAAYFNHLRTIMPVAVHDVLRDLEEITEERRQLLVQRRFHLWLHTWLLVHVPLSFAFLVLTAVHAVLSLRY